MALLSLAGAASEPRRDAGAALLRAGTSSAADAAAGAGAPPAEKRAETSAEIGERFFDSLDIKPNSIPTIVYHPMQCVARKQNVRRTNKARLENRRRGARGARGRRAPR
jgi:hypothetical protein